MLLRGMLFVFVAHHSIQAKEQERGDVVSAAAEVERLKLAGNKHFETACALSGTYYSDENQIDAEFEQSMLQWENALAKLGSAPLAATITANRLAVVLHCNKAAALLKQHKFVPALVECNKVRSSAVLQS